MFYGGKCLDPCREFGCFEMLLSNMENHFVTFMLALLLSYVAFWSPFVEKFPLYNLYIWVFPTHTHPNLICVDYHKLNKVTLPDPNTMPLIEELLNAVGRASCLS